MIVSEDVIRHN